MITFVPANARMAAVQTSRAIAKAVFRVFDLCVLGGLEEERVARLDGILRKDLSSTRFSPALHDSSQCRLAITSGEPAWSSRQKIPGDLNWIYELRCA